MLYPTISILKISIRQQRDREGKGREQNTEQITEDKREGEGMGTHQSLRPRSIVQGGSDGRQQTTVDYFCIFTMPLGESILWNVQNWFIYLCSSIFASAFIVRYAGVARRSATLEAC